MANTFIAMTETEFLELNIFYDLKNQNTGYDANDIWHFSSKDFEIVMDRADELDVRILGIECWEKEEEKFTKFREDYNDENGWYRKAYKELSEEYSPCIYTATFDIPSEYLQVHPKS